jgi:hypothetical protein
MLRQLTMRQESKTVRFASTGRDVALVATFSAAAALGCGDAQDSMQGTGEHEQSGSDIEGDGNEAEDEADRGDGNSASTGGSVDLRGAPSFYSRYFTKPGDLGWPCSQDSDCKSDLCIEYGGADPDYKVCSAACDGNEDCTAMLENAVNLQVPLQYEAFSGTATNRWNSEVLTQGSLCAEGGAERDVCRFACPIFSGVVLDDEGVPEACACLPGFKNANDDGLHCVWDTEVTCSLVSYPDGKPVHPCNRETASGGFDTCSEDVSEPRCALFDNGSFEGKCMWWADNLEACISASSDNCNDGCIQQCYASNFDNGCFDLCCQ